MTQARFSLGQLIANVIKSPNIQSFSSIILASTTATSFETHTDAIAQFFSRTVTVTAIIVCVAGFILLLIKRNLNTLEKAIFLSGVIYSALGLVLNTLGYRSLALAFIPISLGAAVLFRRKIRPYFALLLSVY